MQRKLRAFDEVSVFVGDHKVMCGQVQKISGQTVTVRRTGSSSVREFDLNKVNVQIIL